MQAVVEDVRGAVRQQGVALHLAQPDAAAELAALDGLLGERVVGPRGADLQGRKPGFGITGLGSQAVGGARSLFSERVQ